jgi:hypothetical protein
MLRERSNFEDDGFVKFGSAIFAIFLRAHTLSCSFLAENVEDAHPQHEHHHPQHEDAIVEVDIFRMLVSYPQTNWKSQEFRASTKP